MQFELALIGHPLSHSFSSAYFNDKFARKNIEARYFNLDLANIDELPGALSKHPKLIGFNVTAPYKRDVMKFLDSIDTAAEEIGAVNTVKITHDMGRTRLKGFNTDYEGFKNSLRPLLYGCRKKFKALVFGSGGASRAVCKALDDLEVEFNIVSRGGGEGRISYAEITPELIASRKLLINATPLGTFPNTETSPLINFIGIGSDHRCYDLVYNPPLSLFLKGAMERGAFIRNGLNMLHGQAEAAYRIWMEQE